jgi:purine-binding chemotaxis protein CheW
MSTSDLQIVIFQLGGEEYAFPVSCVQEIQGYDQLSPPRALPQAPPFLEGMINLRSTILPVIDLQRRFGGERIQPGRSTRYIIVELGHERLAVLVDAVREVIRIPVATLQAPPPRFRALVQERYISAIGRLPGSPERLVVMLDAQQLLDPAELQQLAKLG